MRENVIYRPYPFAPLPSLPSPRTIDAAGSVVGLRARRPRPRPRSRPPQSQPTTGRTSDSLTVKGRTLVKRTRSSGICPRGRRRRMASDGCIVLWGWEREGSRRIVLTIWSATGSEQQPRGLFKDAISIDGIFKSRHKSAVVVVFHSKLLRAVALQPSRRRCSNH